MTTELALGLASLVAVTVACGAPPPAGSALTAGPKAPPDVRAACELATQRCAQCHPIERVLLARVSLPVHWERYVDRMRHQPESRITEDDGRTIVRCLVFRSFGAEGLGSLEERTTQ